MKTSMTSVTFTKKSIPEVILLAKHAGLDAIEWGGDTHIVPGDYASARAARFACIANGLSVSAYGSYYMGGEKEDFRKILDTADCLECPTIRIWAGSKGSSKHSEMDRKRLIDRLAEAVRLGLERGVDVATEFHADTLTDTVESTQRLLSDVPGLQTYWQPMLDANHEENLKGLVMLEPFVKNIHVFHWIGYDRRPLADGIRQWGDYLRCAANAQKDRYATLEFVKNDDPEQFFRDAGTLCEILKSI